MFFVKAYIKKKYLQHFESDVHVAYAPSLCVEELTLGKV
jgi:hypothetical protein